MLLHDKIVWYDKVLRHHAARMLSGFYSRDGWAHVARGVWCGQRATETLNKT